MKFFGISIFEPSMVQKATENFALIAARQTEDEALALVKASLARPGTDRLDQLGGEGVRIPYYPIPPRTLFDISKYSDTTRTILLALKKETFRNGIIVDKLYAQKCAVCGAEYDDKTESGFCDKKKKDEAGVETVCGGALSPPDEAWKSYGENYMKNVNENRQTLQEVEESVHQDVGIIDDGFSLILKEYSFDKATGALLNAEIKEILRGDPIIMRIIADRQGRPGRNDKGNKIFTCVEHRDVVWEHVEGAITNKSKCPTCGKQLYQAFFKADMETSGSMGQDGKRGTYYIEGEVIHKSLYTPGLTYGFSPIATAWQKIVTLMYQDSYIKEYYGRERPPRGLLFINTSNNASLQKAWQAHRDIMRNNPHDIYPIGVEFTKESGSKLVEWLEFVKPLVDMEYVETRNEYRRTIGAVWGVQPIFQGDIQQSGGLNNEGLQLTVTNRASLANQQYVNFHLEEISRQVGLIEHGWIYRLAPVEIKDEMSEELLKAQKIANAVSMKNLGYEAELLDEDMNFEFKKSQTPAPGAGLALPGQPPAGGYSPPTPTSQPAAGNPMEESGTPMKSGDKKKGLSDLYRDEIEVAMKSDDGFVAKAMPTQEKFAALEQAVFKRNFDGMDKNKSDQVREYLIDAALRNATYSDMTRQVAAMAGIPEEDAERLVKTELHEMRAKLRELAYQETQPEDALYKWVSVPDARRTEICEHITEKTKRGVTLDTLKGIIAEEAQKGGFKAREFSPHINCRSTFVRYFA